MKKEYFFIAIAGILSGLITFGGRIFAERGLSLYEISIIPYILSLIFFLPWILINRKFKIKTGLFYTYIIYGIIICLLTLTEIGGVVLGVPVAIAVLLIYTQPFWTVLFGRIFLKEKINLCSVVSCILVLIGAFILVNPFQEKFSIFSPGIIVSILSGVLLSIWIMMGRVSGTKGSDPISTQFWSGLFAIVFFVLFYFPVKFLIKDTTISRLSFNIGIVNLVYLIIFTFLIHIVSHMFFFNGIKKVPSSEAGIILLLEPLSATLLAAIFLSQAITLNIIIGGIIILLANYLVIKYGVIRE